jgi:TolA-binding protein
MIDSDIHIEDKKIFKRIEKGIKKGIVFFSNLPVLNSNYVEALTFYNLLYHREVAVPAILPLISESIGSTGTACFRKSLYKECGKYNVEINKLGYGCDDMEFYLRYLNTFFYRHYKEQKLSIDQSLDGALVHFMTFPGATFRDIENPEEEKERFYPQNKESSALNTISFIHRFFDHFPFPYHQSYETKRRRLKETDLQGFAIPPSFLHWFRHWYGRKLFEQNNLEESQTYFKQLLQQKKVKPGYLAEAHFFLGEIQRRQGKKNFRAYYSQSLPFLLYKKGKSGKDLYFIASLYKRLGDSSKAKQWFQKILKSNKGTYLHPGVYFHLGEISYLEKRYKSANTYFLKCRALNPLHQKCREFLEELEKIKQSGKKDELK